MEKQKTYLLCEAAVDITLIAIGENYTTEDSREMVSQFIHWAEEFEYIHQKIEWGINSPLDYLETIYDFTMFKIKQKGRYETRPKTMGER